MVPLFYLQSISAYLFSSLPDSCVCHLLGSRLAWAETTGLQAVLSLVVSKYPPTTSSSCSAFTEAMNVPSVASAASVIMWLGYCKSTGVLLRFQSRDDGVLWVRTVLMLSEIATQFLL